VNVSITADPPQPVSIVTSAAVPLRGRIEFDGDITGASALAVPPVG
jgi:hypothetical protein